MVSVVALGVLTTSGLPRPRAGALIPCPLGATGAVRGGVSCRQMKLPKAGTSWPLS